MMTMSEMCDDRYGMMDDRSMMDDRGGVDDRSVVHNRSMDDRSVFWVISMSTTFYDSVETVVWISGVFNDTDGTVWFLQGIFSLNGITDTGFVLLFLITGMVIGDTVFEIVMSWSLERVTFLEIELRNFGCTYIIIYNMSMSMTVSMLSGYECNSTQ